MAKKTIITNVELGDSGEVSKDKINKNFEQLDNAVDVLDGETVKIASVTSRLGFSTNNVPNEFAVSEALKGKASLSDLEKLDAHKKGYFSTEAQLKATHPKPISGDYAYIGETNTVWEVVGSQWKDTGKPIPESANLNEYEKITYRQWLRDKTVNYSKSELGAIGRILNLQLYVNTILEEDVYTINIMKVDDLGSGAIAVYKNGSPFISTSLNDKSQNKTFHHPSGHGTLEVSYDFKLSSLNLDTASSTIVISPSHIHLRGDYFKLISYELVDRTTDKYGNTTTASVSWSDGSSGTYTASDYNRKFRCYDSYSVKHNNSFLNIRQPKVTRNAIGVITNKPKLIISL